jgi:trimeric autotransporter adhesin
VAQDFYAAFALGTDDKHIATVDAEGVALAAIQGLNQKLEETEARISVLEKTVAQLKTLIQQPSESRAEGKL